MSSHINSTTEQVVATTKGTYMSTESKLSRQKRIAFFVKTNKKSTLKDVIGKNNISKIGNMSTKSDMYRILLPCYNILRKSGAIIEYDYDLLPDVPSSYSMNTYQTTKHIVGKEGKDVSLLQRAVSGVRNYPVPSAVPVTVPIVALSIPSAVPVTTTDQPVTEKKTLIWGKRPPITEGETQKRGKKYQPIQDHDSLLQKTIADVRNCPLPIPEKTKLNFPPGTEYNGHNTIMGKNGYMGNPMATFKYSKDGVLHALFFREDLEPLFHKDILFIPDGKTIGNYINKFMELSDRNEPVPIYIRPIGESGWTFKGNAIIQDLHIEKEGIRYTESNTNYRKYLIHLEYV